MTHDDSDLLHAFAGSWWVVLLRGIAAVLFGIAAFIWPALTLTLLVLIYGVYTLADGIIALLAAATGRAKAIPRWWLVAVGVLSIVTGAVTLLWPGITALVLAIFIGVWAVAHGLLEIVAAFALRREIGIEWWLIAAGTLSVVFGAFVLMSPGAGALALIWTIGAYSIAFGALLVGCSLRLRKLHHA
jgi:uncharacterized membrane protein HdeD (DUF308 family)